MVKPARPANAPGYKCKANRDGTWREYWECRTDIRKRGYKPANVRLHFGALAADREQLGARCTRLQAEMLSWAAHGGQFVRAGYSGTVASLAHQFQTHPASSYCRLKWNSQRAYDAKIKIIAANVGARQVRALTAQDFYAWHAAWGAPTTEGKPARPFRARLCIAVLRAMMSFGTVMAWSDCERADRILGKLRFPKTPDREARLEWHHVQAIRAAAHREGRPSIALAQTLMFELSFRQKDVIGEWVPNAQGQGGIVRGGKRWALGLQWSDISEYLVLSKKTSKTGSRVAFDLRLYPSVMEEINRTPAEQRIGPMIVNETTGSPYTDGFARTWRGIARAAGVPDAVQNRDSRAGGITEGLDAGAVLSDVAKHAGHADTKQTMAYDRNPARRSATVAKLRTAKRDES